MSDTLVEKIGIRVPKWMKLWLERKGRSLGGNMSTAVRMLVIQAAEKEWNETGVPGETAPTERRPGVA